MLNVYQIILTSTVINEINRLNNREAAEKTFPQYAAYSRGHFGAKDFLATDFVHFTKVAEVEATELEECFTIMNRWEPEDEEKVTRLNQMHSLSVGDIVEKDGKFFFCDNCGFKEVHVPAFVASVVK